MDKVFDKWTFARFQKVLSLAFGVCMLSLALTACGDSSDDVAGGSAEEEGIIAIKDKTVSGVSQKGPFVNGSSVQLFELNGKTYAPTGRTFPGKISNDKGEFKIAGINLESQYAFLEASGYYRNEVTGEKSAAPITLNAISDLSKRETVNINLLTHLEYERVMKLVEDGMSIAKAKKQAEQEVFAAFGIEGNFDNSEDLNIFESSEADAALLAISIILQGERSEADLSEFLANFAQDIAEDGKWDDEKKKAEIADWLEQVYFSKSLDEIRSHFVEWEIKVDSTYESYLAKYWWTNYGLGVCEKNRDGEIKKNANDKSKNVEKYYVCTENIWKKASVIQKDTYGWNAGKKGEKRKGEITGSVYIYENEWVMDSLLDLRDNQKYKIARIGDQTWMAQNLNYKTDPGSWCFQNDEKNCKKLGRLYDWERAMEVCPEGFHLPSNEEWEKILSYPEEYEIDAEGYEHSKCVTSPIVISVKQNYYNEDGEDFYEFTGTNETGFGAILSGVRIGPSGSSSGQYYSLGEVANYWSSTEISATMAYHWYVSLYSAGLYTADSDYYKDYGFSVRCVKDVE